MPTPPNPSDARKQAPRPPGRRRCRNCLQPFTKKRNWQVFCKPKCRDTHRNDAVRLEKVKDEE